MTDPTSPASHDDRARASGRRWFAIAAVAAAASLVACGGDDGDDDPSATGAAEATSTTTADQAPTTVEAPTEPPSGVAPCGLVADAELATVFPEGAPAGAPDDFGAGFAECAFEDEAADDGGRLIVSVVPAGNFASDYVEQLNPGPPVSSEVLGAEAASFPGIVGIGRASSGGASVGFVAGDVAVIVAADGPSEDAAADLAVATSIAEAAAGRL